MVGLGSAIGAGLSVAGSIFGGISASKAMKKVKGNLEEQRSKNQDWYDRRYNEDATQRAEAQAAWEMAKEDFRNRTREATGAAAVAGGSAESVAASKAASTKALGQMASTIAVNGERRKDNIEAQYQTKDEALQQQLNDLEMRKAGEVTNAIKGVASEASNIAGIL